MSVVGGGLLCFVVGYVLGYSLLWIRRAEDIA